MLKKGLALCLAGMLTVSLCAGCSPDNAAVQVEEYPVYASYTDIPGVSQEEIDAIERLRSSQSAFTLAQLATTEAFIATDGSVGGYSKLLCNWLTDLFGIPFNPELAAWDDLMAGLASHRFDFTNELTATDERRETYFMTDAIAERFIRTFRLADSPRFSEIAAERTLRYGFLEGTTTKGLVEESSEYDFDARFVQNSDEVATLLRNGSIDAFFAEGVAEAALDEYPDIVARDYFPLIYTPVSLATPHAELAPIISVVQKYLEQGALYQLTELYNQGEQEYLQHKLYLQLSDEEKAWLARNQQNGEATAGGVEGIPITAEPDNYPISFYNTEEKEWQGIAHDVLAEIERLTGLRFAIRNEPDTTWTELLRQLEEGEVALTTELVPSLERQGHFLWPASSYSMDNYALISLSGKANIEVNQIWYSRVGIIEGSVYLEMFEKWFPNHQYTRLYATSDACYQALETGDVDFVMATRDSMLSMTNYHERPGFKVNILFDNVYESRFGLAVGEEELCSIIGKAQELVDTETIASGWLYRVFDYRDKLAREQQPFLIGLTLLLITVLALLLIMLYRRHNSARRLQALVHQRTRELEVQTEVAQQASKAKGDFLSNMSHEIRTPLNAIIGMAQISRQVAGVPEKARKANNSIIAASDHLLGVLNDILDMAKIESGKFTLVTEPFALLVAMREVEEIFTQRCTEKHIGFVATFDEGVDTGVEGDKLRLKQVLINLLGNAVKFTDAHGHVSFTVQTVRESDRDITLEFAVQDTGIGMTEEQCSRLFTPFSQTEDSISVRYGGTGLGLAISQTMVQKMGGEIKVQSRLGEGSRFFFVATFAKAQLPQLPEYARETPDFEGRRLLLAEDVEVNRVILRELLADSGVLLEDAENGREAVERFEASPVGYYDAVLMDIQMPLMNGHEAARAIRQLPREDALTVPIIAMTANAFNEDVEKALASGMNRHLAKPVDVAIVYSTLHEFLGQGGGRR
jgi:signal transduction histidine kinase/CheY-like chemotaxis protein